MSTDIRQSITALLQTSVSPPVFLRGEPRVIIYGAGDTGHAVYGWMERRGTAVRCFLDQKATPGSQWEGVPVLLPDDPSITEDVRRQTPVVVAVFNFQSDLRPIFAQLRALGYGKAASIVEIYDYFAPELGNRFWLTSQSFYRERAAEIAAAADLWADERSRKLYASVIEYRLTGNHEVLPEPDQVRQYLPNDVPPWHSPVRLVDCGAYLGDTLAAFIEKGMPVEAAALFEPDLANFAKLADFVRDGLPPELDVTLWPCAVGSRTEILPFSTGKGEASCLQSTGGTMVQCVALDEAIPRFRPSLIKLDVEGAEFAVLRGAFRIIRDHRPELAVCLYHRPEHLWQIPLTVRLWSPAYRLYLRLHTFNCFELVMYAIPE